MAVHTCTEPGCGLVHDAIAAEQRESDEVIIARVNAQRDVDVARASVKREADWNEARVEVAEIEAGATVESAVIEGEIVAAALEASNVEAEPIEIIAPDVAQTVDVDVDEDAPPETEGSLVPAESKPHGLGMW